MTPKEKTREEWAREVEALRARLDEAEETLRAIRSGEVDALVVAGPHGDQIFTLISADHPYRVFIEEMNEGALTLSDEGLILYCNRTFAGIVKTPMDQVVGASFESFVETPDLPAFRTMLQDSRDGQIVGEINARAVAGPSVPLRLSLNRLPSGYIGLTCIVVTDLTEPKRAETALRQAEEKYRSIFEGAQEGIYRSTPEGRIVLANPAMARILGYESPHELIAVIDDVNRKHYVSFEERAETIERVEKDGSVAGLEVQFYRKDGTVVWCSRSMRAIRDDNGKTIYYEGIIEDITERKQSTERLRKALRGTVQAIAGMVETRDPYTAGHQRRVSDLARAIATQMNLSYEQIDGLRTAGTIHDKGKISVPAEILSMPRKLTPIEFSLIKTHSQSGYDILKDIELPWPIARMILEHHERMDGSGYPNGLTGDKLLLESRILTVADVVEAIASHRPYRPALGIDAALNEIDKNRGTHYDNAVADACLRLFREKGYQLGGHDSKS